MSVDNSKENSISDERLKEKIFNEIIGEKTAFVEKIDFKAGDFIPSIADIEKNLGPNYEDSVDFLLWIRETSIPMTEDDYKTICFIDDILYDFYTKSNKK